MSIPFPYGYVKIIVSECPDCKILFVGRDCPKYDKRLGKEHRRELYKSSDRKVDWY